MQYTSTQVKSKSKMTDFKKTFKSINTISILLTIEPNLSIHPYLLCICLKV